MKLNIKKKEKKVLEKNFMFFAHFLKKRSCRALLYHSSSSNPNAKKNHQLKNLREIKIIKIEEKLKAKQHYIFYFLIQYIHA